MQEAGKKSGNVSSLFDAYIIVDWSAASKPTTGTDSIWIGNRWKGPSGEPSYNATNPPTRWAAQGRLLELIDAHLHSGRTVLVGFDFAFGFPSGTARALALDLSKQVEWMALHGLITERMVQEFDNRNGRFEFAEELNARMSGGAAPFWGAPHQRPDSELLSKTKRNRLPYSDGPSDHRITETWVRDNYPANPKSVWQLAYSGAVGSQVLLGLPTVTMLRTELPQSRIWPFETGFTDFSGGLPPDTRCILAEVYPSTVQVLGNKQEVKDAEQVRALSDRLLNADKAGMLGRAFDVPQGLKKPEISKIISEEGWILTI